MATPFNDFINNDLIPRIYQNPDIVFPNLHFKQVSGKLISPYKKDGTHPKTPNREKTVIREKTPYLIFEGGEQPEEIIKFIVRQYNYNGVYEAIKDLSGKLGLTPPQFNSEDYIKYQEKIEAYNNASDEMRQALFSPEAEPILKQLTEGRGYTIDEIKEMGLGYINADIALKYRDKVFIPYGVEINNQIVIPFESGGKIEGFKFRATTGQAKAKYINSRFSKNNFLFGLSAIPMTKEEPNKRLVYLVDGELKALYMKIKGVENVVSGAGSASAIISDEQIKQAKLKGVKHIVIIADNESTEGERANEARKINNTLQLLNNADISGYVVYLPHDDTTRKEDVEDYLQKYGVESLRGCLNNPESGATFRTKQIIEKYKSELNESGEFSTIQRNNLFIDLFQLLKEYGGTDTADIKDTAEYYLGGNGVNWIDVIEKGAEEARWEHQQKRQEKETRTLIKGVNELLEKGDIKGALRLANGAKEILEKGESDEFAPMFAPENWSDTIEELKQKTTGIEPLYILKRGKETDILTFPSGALSIIAAPTNHGKSTFLQNIALQSARDKRYNGANIYLTFEESPKSVKVQFLSKIIGKKISANNKRSIKSYYQGEEQYITDVPALHKGEREITELFKSNRLRIFGTEAINGISIDVIKTLTRFITQATKNFKEGVRAVFIDYVQLIQPDERIKNRYEELKVICTTLKNLAIKLNIPIILAAQFSREGALSPYELEAEGLGEGGDIERSASVIVGLWNTGKKPRKGTKFDKDNKIWLNEDNSHNYKIEFDENNPKIYLRLLKSREEATGGEALLNCDLNIGIIEPNTTPEEIKRLKESGFTEKPQAKGLSIFDIMQENDNSFYEEPEEEPPY